MEENKMSNESSPSYALIDGVEISELELLRYEVKRARIAAFLLYEKIGAQNLPALLKNEIEAMAQIEQDWLERSDGEWTGSVTEIRVKAGNAAGFLRWFQDRTGSDDRAMLFNAHPEHYAVVRAPNGRVSILETTGGWKLPSLFYARFTQNERDAVEALDPNLPFRLIGHLESEDGVGHGRVLHQFGNTSYGFHARLGIYWPAKADRDMVKGHQWHLACEFVNWARMYAESCSDASGPN
jgi:hypothetical protein